MKRAFFAVACLACLSCPARAGSIEYDFWDIHYHSGIARIDFDDSALARGMLTNADLQGGGFLSFMLSDLLPFAIPITADGLPIFDQYRITGLRYDYDGTPNHLEVGFDPAAFDPDRGGFYQLHGNTAGVYGEGYWTATIVPTIDPAPVPEPSSLALIAVAFVVIASFRRHLFPNRKRSSP